MSLSEYKTQNTQKNNSTNGITMPPIINNTEFITTPPVVAEETPNLNSQATIAPQTRLQHIMKFYNIDQLEAQQKVESQRNAKLLVILNTGEHCLISFTLISGESYFLEDVLRRFGIPFTDQTNIQCILNPRACIDNIDFIAMVGFNSNQVSSDIATKLQIIDAQATTSQIDQQSAVEHSHSTQQLTSLDDKTVSSIDLVEKEEVPKFTPKFISLCHSCGFCIFDNDKCERCDVNFVEEPKDLTFSKSTSANINATEVEQKRQLDVVEGITSTSGLSELSTQVKLQQDEKVVFSTGNYGDNDKFHPPSLKQINTGRSSNSITMPPVLDEAAAVATASLALSATEETTKIIPQTIIPPQIIPSQNQIQQECDPQKNIKMLIILNSGENILVTFTLPSQSCTVHEILKQAGIPFTHETSIHFGHTPGTGIDYVVTVGITVPESTIELIPAAENSLQIIKAQDTTSQIVVEQPNCSQPSSGDENVTSVDSKVLPSEYNTSSFALCNSCGNYGIDHYKCERCHQKFIEELNHFPSSMLTAAKLNATDDETKRHMTLIQNPTATPRQGKPSTQMRPAEVKCKLMSPGNETVTSTTFGYDHVKCESSAMKVNVTDKEKERHLNNNQKSTFKNCPGIAIRQRPARVMFANNRDRPYGLPRLPRNEDEWKTEANLFDQLWNFPHCIGAIDGKHVEITKPPGSGSYFFNYKKHFSIVLMALVKAN